MKNLFNELIKKKKLFTGDMYDKFIYTNNHIDLIHDACKLCYDQKDEETRQDKLNYIERRVKTGHDSILEHSNIVLYFIINNDVGSLLELTEVLEVSKYLNVKTKTINDNTHIIMGGSIRAYKHIFKNIDNQNNRLSKLILNNLFVINKEYFPDFVNDNITPVNKFSDLEYDYKPLLSKTIVSNNIEISNIDNIEYIYNECNKVFTYDELLDICTVTVFFKDISRVISQQITRHRNGITQLSQRYVNYNSGKFLFNSPANYKNKYDENYRYPITFNGITTIFTLQELGEELMKIYNQLVSSDLGSNKLIPEDARAYLPNNAQTSLYMTFTFKNLIKFLELRTDSHAQAEIRILAKSIEDVFKPTVEKVINDNIYNCLTPKYIKITRDFGEYDNIDEIID